MDLGARSPRSVLYPTCDDYAWLQALHADELSRHYELYAPGRDVIETLLDKRLLHEACAKADIRTPKTFFPESEADVLALAESAPMPLLLKQRTQVLSRTRSKGHIVTARGNLSAAYREFVRDNAHAPPVLASMPHASQPLLQTYHAEGVSGSTLVSGFIDRSGKHFVARAASKVLQRPRSLGIALCLEAIALDDALAEQVRALCTQVGYFGVFQVEFLNVGEERLLIDFNPRYYHYLAFDIARGMRLPLMAHYAARNDEASLAREIAAAQHAESGEAHVFTYRLQLRELLLAQTLAGTMTRQEAARWRNWSARHQAEMVDAVYDAGDRMPSLVDAWSHIVHRVRHPRSFVRHIALDQ